MYINGLYLAVRNTLKTQPRRPCLLTYASQRAPVIGRSGYTSESLPCKLQPHFYMHKRRPRVEEQPEWMRAHILHVVLYPPVASHQKALWLHNAKNRKATCPVRPTRRSLLVRYLHSRHFVGQPPTLAEDHDRCEDEWNEPTAQHSSLNGPAYDHTVAHANRFQLRPQIAVPRASIHTSMILLYIPWVSTKAGTD